MKCMCCQDRRMLTEFMEYVEKRFQSGPEDSDVPIDASLREKGIEGFLKDRRKS